MSTPSRVAPERRLSSTTGPVTSAAATTAATTTDTAKPTQRTDETLLTGTTLDQVKAAALAKLGSDATVVRVETDADGNAAYEAHMQKATGTQVTVYVDEAFSVVSLGTDSGQRGGGHANGADSTPTDSTPTRTRN